MKLQLKYANKSRQSVVCYVGGVAVYVVSSLTTVQPKVARTSQDHQPTPSNGIF
jgi:hypothetical protein